MANEESVRQSARKVFGRLTELNSVPNASHAGIRGGDPGFGRAVSLGDYQAFQVLVIDLLGMLAADNLKRCPHMTEYAARRDPKGIMTPPRRELENELESILSPSPSN